MGLRVGEVISGGDFHGLMANHLSILTHRETGEVSVEGLLEHSKTKRKRYINALGTSCGPAAVRLADHLREYWQSSGLRTHVRDEGLYSVEGPDYFVLRLSLMGLGDTDEECSARLGLLERLLQRSASADARLWADYSMRRARERERAETSMDKRYVNLTGGARLSADISTLCLELTTAGFGGLLSVIPGPLMRSTHFRTPVRFTHMPLTVQSTYEVMHELFDRAYEQLLAAGGDPELDLQGLAAPLWGHHSLRRLADTVARQTREISGASEQDIDMIFGWLEAMYSHRMQLHYESRFDRTRRSMVTSQM